MTDDYDLNNLPEIPERNGNAPIPGPFWGLAKASPAQSESSDKKITFDLAQWTCMGPDQFLPSGKSLDRLPAGFYKIAALSSGAVYAEKQPLVTDDLTVLPGSCNESVIDGIRKFWESRTIYQQYGLNYKRGVLFYGPPGAGKSAMITLLCKELITSHNGLVLVCGCVDWLIKFVHDLRKIEADRQVIIVMEDIDEIIQANGEHGILSLLDGEAQIDNVVFVASTNYPDRLGARIVNRPSRFDERIFVDMPSDETRRAYLRTVTDKAQLPLKAIELRKWADDTRGMSIAHLRELVIAVRCLGRDYEDTVNRLKSMSVRPKTKEGIGSQRMGIAV